MKTAAFLLRFQESCLDGIEPIDGGTKTITRQQSDRPDDNDPHSVRFSVVPHASHLGGTMTKTGVGSEPGGNDEDPRATEMKLFLGNGTMTKIKKEQPDRHAGEFHHRIVPLDSEK